MLRLIFLIVTAYLLYVLFRQVLMPAKRQILREGEKKDTVLVRDPVCNMYIARESAVTYKGEHFCSEKCRHEFEKEGVS